MLGCSWTSQYRFLARLVSLDCTIEVQFLSSLPSGTHFDNSSWRTTVSTLKSVFNTLGGANLKCPYLIGCVTTLLSCSEFTRNMQDNFVKKRFPTKHSIKPWCWCCSVKAEICNKCLFKALLQVPATQRKSHCSCSHKIEGKVTFITVTFPSILQLFRTCFF